MQHHPYERIDSKPEPSLMAIMGAILAKGAIRFLDRQKKGSKGPLRKASTPLSHYKTE